MKQSPTAEDAKRAITVDELISRLSKLFPSKEERTLTRIIPNFEILEKNPPTEDELHFRKCIVAKTNLETLEAKYSQTIAVGNKYGGKVIATGNNSIVLATGNNTAAIAANPHSIAVCGVCPTAAAQGVLGSWLILTCSEPNTFRGDEGKLKRVVAVQVDGKKIKPNTLYKLDYDRRDGKDWIRNLGDGYSIVEVKDMLSNETSNHG